jgi:hypothetical protein
MVAGGWPDSNSGRAIGRGTTGADWDDGTGDCVDVSSHSEESEEKSEAGSEKERSEADRLIWFRTRESESVEEMGCGPGEVAVFHSLLNLW